MFHHIGVDDALDHELAEQYELVLRHLPEDVHLVLVDDLERPPAVVVLQDLGQSRRLHSDHCTESQSDSKSSSGSRCSSLGGLRRA